MSYHAHGFIEGTRFYASYANEMDNQIEQNALDIESLLATRNDTDNIFLDKMNQLSIDCDSDTLYLRYGDYVLATAAIPMDLSTFVPCTGIELSDVGSSIDLNQGQNMQFSTVRIPSDCTQNVRWTLSDLTKATITGNGLLTALQLGPVTVTASCGAHNDSVIVNIKKTIDLSSGLSALRFIVYENTTGKKAINVNGNDDGTPYSMVVPVPYDLNKYAIPNGRTLTVSLADLTKRVSVRCFVFKPWDNREITVRDNLEEASNLYTVYNTEVLDSQRIHERTKDGSGTWGYWGVNEYTYTNNTGETVYFIFGFQDDNHIWDQSQDPETEGPAVALANLRIVIS